MPQNDIPVKILKFNANFVSPFISNVFNESIENDNFPDDLKLADITPVYKKNSRNDKVNYRPVSILPVLSKVFEKRTKMSTLSKFTKM